MEISVIIPSYKPGKYIEACLESLQRQTLDIHSFEILIVLNGCNQPWYNDISTFIQNNLNGLNISIFQTNVGGVSYARNIGIDCSHGKYIAFIDDDDYVSPGYLKGLLDVADENSVILSDSIAFNDGEDLFDYNYSMHRTYLKCSKKKNASLMDIRRLLNGPCMKLIPRKIIGNIRFNVAFSNGEDGLFIYEITRNVSKFKFAADTAVYYRRFRPNSAVTKKDDLGYIWLNACHLSYIQTKIYLNFFSKYNAFYSLVRIIASFKGALYRSLNLK